MMNHYYFLAASLPPLVLGELPEISFEDLEQRLSVNLSKDDLEKIKVLRRFIDLENIRCLFQGIGIDPRGNLNEKQLDEALLIENILPEYVFDFLNRFESKEEKLTQFYGLVSRFFQEESKRCGGFLRKYFTFEREHRLVLLALRAKKWGRDLFNELRFEDQDDPLAMQILSQVEDKMYEPPIEYEELKELFFACGNDPWQQFRSLSQYRFKRIEEISGHNFFSIDWILGYVARLLIVENWSALDEKQGKEILEKFKTG